MTVKLMDKRIALVTGATSGIGKEIATQLTQNNFIMACHSRSLVTAGQKLAAAHPDPTYSQADLSDQNQARQLINRVLCHCGRLDMLVNNAGITATIPHADLKGASPDIWRSLYEVNVIASWTLITGAEAALRQSASQDRPSCIINVSSHAGARPKRASVPYAVSKAALNHVTKLLAVSLTSLIRVNAISLGLVNTPMSKNWTVARELWKERSPMQRGAQLEEIAQLALMLIRSSYVTGEILLACGGLNLT